MMDAYTLPEIADKIERGDSLNEIERQMASATIREFIRRVEKLMARRVGGRPKKFSSDAERYAHHNAQRRKKTG